MTLLPTNCSRAMGYLGIALLIVGAWVSVSVARKPAELRHHPSAITPQAASDRSRATDQGGYGAWCRAEIRRDAQKGWQTVSADTSWSNLEKIAVYLAQWIDEDSDSAIEAFGMLAREHPDLIGDIAVFCGNHWSGENWAAVETNAKGKLRGFDLKAFTLIVARGVSRSEPNQALLMLDALGDPEGGNLYSAQLNVRGLVIESCVKLDFKYALDWLDQHKSWTREWMGFCRAAAESGIDRIPESELSRMLSKVPIPNRSVLGELMGPDKGQNKAIALKLVKALDMSDPPEEREQWRAGVISALAEHVPEIFNSEYFDSEHKEDALAVGIARKGSLQDGLAWAETLRPTGAEEQAIKGIVYQMMHANSYMASQEIDTMDEYSPQKRIAINAMIQWLQSRGKSREAAVWQSHLDKSENQGSEHK